MYLKYNNNYKFINNNLKLLIINLFIKIESVFNENKRKIKILKKKIINYNFLL